MPGDRKTMGPLVPRRSDHVRLGPMSGGSIRLRGGFWGRRQMLNREVTIPHGMQMLEESGSLENLRIAAGLTQSDYHDPIFRDSDVYKVLEAIAWERQHGADADQDRFFSSSAHLIAAAQEPDGYLNSHVQVCEPARRFENPAMNHELYCAGHLFQATVAEARSGDGPSLLAPITERFADYLHVVLNQERPSFIPGHPEIETALVELYRQTGTAHRLELASGLIRRRGQNNLRWRSFGPEYFQDDLPLTKAKRVRGHVVRGLYLLAGAADTFIETGQEDLLQACLDQWEDAVSTKTYITGGMGSRHVGESFGEPFELPSDRGYCETCAAIASIMWNWRLSLITGESRFADLVERTLYNGFLSGWGLDGKSFFYVNPLKSRGSQRKPWFWCACCPPNIMRLIASLEYYFASHTAQGIQLHQFAPMSVRQPIAGGLFALDVDTDYPFDTAVTIAVTQSPELDADLAVRVPSWAGEASVTLNGRPVPAEPESDGYLHVRRRWRAGDELVVGFPARARVLRPDFRIDAIRSCVALERGPLVYCVEATGTGAPSLDGLELPTNTGAYQEQRMDIGDQPVVALRCQASRRLVAPAGPLPYQDLAEAGDTPTLDAEVLAIPYFTWANRGGSEMRVWLPSSDG